MRVFVSGWVGAGNVGDELIHHALVRRLRALGAQVAVASLTPEDTRQVHGVAAVSHRRLASVRSAIAQADLLLLGGGGLVQDATSVWSPLYQMHRPFLASSTGTPLAGVGLGAEPLHPVNRRLVRAALESHVGMTVRDRASLEALRSCGLGGLELAADLVLSLPAPDVEITDEIVVCLRSPSTGTAALPSSWRRPPGRAPSVYARLAAAAMDQIAAATGCRIRMISMEPERDDPLHRDVAEQMRTTATVEDATLDLLRVVGRARAVISTRYHGVVAAVATGRPVVAIGYAPKVDALANEIGRGSRLVPDDPGALVRLPEAVSRVIDREDEVAQAGHALRERERANARLLERLLSFPSTTG